MKLLKVFFIVALIGTSASIASPTLTQAIDFMKHDANNKNFFKTQNIDMKEVEVLVTILYFLGVAVILLILALEEIMQIRFKFNSLANQLSVTRAV